MAWGVLPSRMRVARPTRADWRDVPLSPADGLIRSLRCFGNRPSGLPPEPLGRMRLPAQWPQVRSRMGVKEWASRQES